MSRIIVLFTSICSHKRAKREEKCYGKSFTEIMSAPLRPHKFCFSTQILDENPSFLSPSLPALILKSFLHIYVVSFYFRLFIEAKSVYIKPNYGLSRWRDIHSIQYRVFRNVSRIYAHIFIHTWTY